MISHTCTQRAPNRGSLTNPAMISSDWCLILWELTLGPSLCRTLEDWRELIANARIFIFHGLRTFRSIFSDAPELCLCDSPDPSPSRHPTKTVKAHVLACAAPGTKVRPTCMLRCIPNLPRPARYSTIHCCRHKFTPLTVLHYII